MARSETPAVLRAEGLTSRLWLPSPRSRSGADGKLASHRASTDYIISPGHKFSDQAKTEGVVSRLLRAAYPGSPDQRRTGGHVPREPAAIQSVVTVLGKGTPVVAVPAPVNDQRLGAVNLCRTVVLVAHGQHNHMIEGPGPHGGGDGLGGHSKAVEAVPGTEEALCSGVPAAGSRCRAWCTVVPRQLGDLLRPGVRQVARRGGNQADVVCYWCIERERVNGVPVAAPNDRGASRGSTAPTGPACADSDIQVVRGDRQPPPPAAHVGSCDDPAGWRRVEQEQPPSPRVARQPGLGQTQRVVRSVEAGDYRTAARQLDENAGALPAFAPAQIAFVIHEGRTREVAVRCGYAVDVARVRFSGRPKDHFWPAKPSQGHNGVLIVGHRHRQVAGELADVVDVSPAVHELRPYPSAPAVLHQEAVRSGSVRKMQRTPCNCSPGVNRELGARVSST